MNKIIRLLVTMLALVLTAKLVPGVTVNSIGAGFWATLILGVVNTFLKPILTLLTLPFTIFTFGLFLLFINGLMLLITAKLVSGFTVASIFAAILASLVLSIISGCMNHALED